MLSMLLNSVMSSNKSINLPGSQFIHKIIALGNKSTNLSSKNYVLI